MAIPGKRIYSNIDLTKDFLRSNTKTAGLIKAELDASGETIFVSTLTGYKHKNINKVFDHNDVLGLTTFKIFDVGQDPMERQGYAQIADEIDLLNRRLANLTPEQELLFKEMGLEHLIGQDIKMAYASFNIKNAPKKVSSIEQLDIFKNRVLTNLTDTGMTVIGYKTGDRFIPQREAEAMNEILGLGKISDSLIDDILHSTSASRYGKLAKLPKRIQSLISHRPVGHTAEGTKATDKFVRELFERDSQGNFKNVYQFDSVSSFFKGMFDPSSLTLEDRYMMTFGQGFNESELKAITYGKDAQVLDELRKRLSQQFKTASGMTDAQIIKLNSVMGEAKRDFDAMSTVDQQALGKEGYFKLFKQKMEVFKNSSDDEARKFYYLYEAVLDNGLEKIRDGTSVANFTLVDKFIAEISQQIEDLKNLPQYTKADIEKYKELQNLLESYKVMKQSGIEETDAVIGRLFFDQQSPDIPGGMIKGEIAFKRFSTDGGRRGTWVPDELKHILLFLDDSAVKSEIQGSMPAFVFNPAKSHADIVYTNPLSLLYHQDYFADDSFIESLEKNAQKQLQAFKNFEQTGYLPEDIRKKLLGAIRSDLKEDLPFNKMTPGARASILRNREESRLIFEMMQSGVDPRDIPSFVTRVKNELTKNAFRLKGDRVDMAAPFVTRKSIKTYESVMDLAEGAKDFERNIIDLRHYGTKGQQLASQAGTNLTDLNFMQFRVKGEMMKITGPNAHLYHHSLGTFDLDDKGNPMLTTFKGADGSDRFAFMTLRDPTGHQEKIFSQADLTDYNTLKKVMEQFEKNGEFKNLLNDSTIIPAAQITPEEQRIIKLMQDIANGKRSAQLDFTGIANDDVNRLMMKLVNEAVDQDKYGFSRFVRMTDQEIIEMASTRSASPLGIDKILQTVGVNGPQQESFRDALAKVGLKADQMPEYTSGNFITIIAEEQAKVEDKIFVEEFKRITGRDFSDMNEVESFVKEAGLSSTQREARRINYKNAIRAGQERIQVMSAIDSSPEGSLGVYINRQSVALSMEKQFSDAIEKLTQHYGFDILEYHSVNHAMGLIPPSPAVDIVKSLVGANMVKADVMKQLAMAIGDIGPNGQNLTLEAVEKLLERIGTGEVTIAEAGEEVVNQMGRSFGFTRALQAAMGVAPEEMTGFDQILFAKKNPFGRMKNIEDVMKVQEKAAEAAQNAIDLLRSINAPQQDIDRAIDELNKITGTSAQDFVNAFRLTPGTAAYNRYATHSLYAGLAEKTRDLFEGPPLQRTVDPLSPTPQAKYYRAVENIVDSQVQNIEELRQLSISLRSEKLLSQELLKSIQEQKLSTFYYEGISKIRENFAKTANVLSQGNQNVNALDIVDTLESIVTSRYGRGISRLVLGSDTAIEGREDSMAELYRDARSRRLQKNTIQRANQQSYDNMQYVAQTYGFNSLEEITKEEATKIITEHEQKLRAAQKDITRLLKHKRNGFDENGFYFGPTHQAELDDAFRTLKAQKSYLDKASPTYGYLQLASERVGVGEVSMSQAPQITPEVIEAYQVSQARSRLAEIEGRYGPSSTGDVLLEGADIDNQVASLIDDFDNAVTTGINRTGVYTRFKDMLKNGAIRDLFEDKLIRNSTYALVGLAAFGLIYSAHKERTKDDASGPPLLPGGSAYERDMPKMLPSLSDLKYLNPTVRGMQYKINVMGSQEDIDKMQYLASNVVNGPVDSTIYSSLPRLGRDPYQEIASRY